MKKTAVICAMADEAQRFVEKLGLENTERTSSGATVFVGNFGSDKIVVTVCGVGKVAAAMTTSEIISAYSPDEIINLGIAGGVSSELKTGDICISDGFVQYDYDLSPLGMKKGELDELCITVINADKSLSEKLYGIAGNLFGNRHCCLGIVATGDTFVSAKETSEMLRREFNASVCDMEGAAIAFVCYMNKIPFCAVRSVSDNADEDSPVDFNEFRKQAVINSTEIMLKFFGK